MSGHQELHKHTDETASKAKPLALARSLQGWRKKTAERQAPESWGGSLFETAPQTCEDLFAALGVGPDGLFRWYLFVWRFGAASAGDIRAHAGSGIRLAGGVGAARAQCGSETNNRKHLRPKTGVVQAERTVQSLAGLAPSGRCGSSC